MPSNFNYIILCIGNTYSPFFLYIMLINDLLSSQVLTDWHARYLSHWSIYHMVIIISTMQCTSLSIERYYGVRVSERNIWKWIKIFKVMFLRLQESKTWSVEVLGLKIILKIFYTVFFSLDDVVIATFCTTVSISNLFIAKRLHPVLAFDMLLLSFSFLFIIFFLNMADKSSGLSFFSL